MFYELMMRSKMKVEEMPLTVVGNPTVVDGVVSGFTTTDYLLLENSLDLSNPFELLFAFTTPTIWGSAYDIVCNAAGSNANRFSILKNGSTKQLQIRIPTYNESTYVQVVTEPNLLENTKYYVRIKYTGTKLFVDFSADKNNWINLYNTDRTNGFPTRVYSFGRNYNSAQQQWGGSIDFNDTYSITNGTKYIYILP